MNHFSINDLLKSELHTLTSRERLVANILASALNRSIAKEDIASRLVAHDIHVSDNAIEVYVHRLRKKLSGHPFKIETVHGYGYKLTLDSPQGIAKKLLTS